MKYSDYPCMFQKSDTASIQQQKYYLAGAKTEMFFIVITAIASGFYIYTQDNINKLFSIITMISIFLAFIVRICELIMKWERKWFDTRAIAESVKTTTWRYVTAIKPYSENVEEKLIDEIFVNELNEIFKARPNAHAAMALCDSSDGQQITDRMREIRKMAIKDRLSLYLKQRVKDQKEWYKNKAKFNESKENFWFFSIMICELLTILLAAFMVFKPFGIFNPIGLMTTLAAIFCAWAQIKKHRELSQSYSLAEQELTSIESLGLHVNDQQSLDEFVINTENAISREHTMWCAKRV